MIKIKYANIAVLVSLVLVAATVPDGKEYDDSEYCRMVEVWKGDASRGIPEAERKGWPPYKGLSICQFEE